MGRISKNPEERKQELIDISIRLFTEKGYENTSVRDILKEVDGAPGMFYHYFKSKKELYKEAVKQFNNKAVEDRLNAINNKSIDIISRFKALVSIVERDIKVFYTKLHNKEEDAYEKAILLEMMNGMSKGVAELIKEAIDEKIVPSNSIINKESAYEISKYIIYGNYGMIESFSKDESEKEIEDVLSMAMKFILNFLNVSPENMEKLLNK